MLQSLYSRFLLMIVSPTLLLAAGTYYAFFERHWDSISENMATNLAREVKVVLEADRYALKQSELANSFGFTLGFRATHHHPPSQHADNPEINLFEQELHELGIKEFSLVQTDPKSDLKLYINYNHYLYDFEISRKRLISPTTHIFTGWLMWLAAFLMVVSLLFLRQQVKSISRLAKAASQFGKGHKVTKFRLSGAKEVRQVGQEFFRMKRRIERQIQQRTELLAGVSHDLRTPLTRMKLILATSKQAQLNQDLTYEVDEMEALIAGYLAFARGESMENLQQITVNKWFKELLNSTHLSIKINFSTKLNDKLQVNWRVLSLKRAIYNILENAAKVATKVEIKLWLDQTGKIAITIEDNGPGISPADRIKVFSAFKSLATKGNTKALPSSGLGLTIARNVIVNHGGYVSIDSSKSLGGAKFIINIPAGN